VEGVLKKARVRVLRKAAVGRKREGAHLLAKGHFLLGPRKRRRRPLEPAVARPEHGNRLSRHDARKLVKQ
jgi:hypothetical protein